MHALLRSAVVVVLAWQAVAGAIAIGRGVVGGAVVGYRDRLFATTDERLARELGPESELWRALREQAADGDQVLSRMPPPEPSNENSEAQHRGALLNKLRHALYPRAFLPRSLRTGIDPEPIPLVETGLRQGQWAWLLVFAGDPSPDGRPGWTCVRRETAFELWRFQKA